MKSTLLTASRLLLSLGAAATCALGENLSMLPSATNGTPPDQQLEKWLTAGVNEMVAVRSAAFEKPSRARQRAASDRWTSARFSRSTSAGCRSAHR